jgi:hypothetical protein
MNVEDTKKREGGVPRGQVKGAGCRLRPGVRGVDWVGQGLGHVGGGFRLR